MLEIRRITAEEINDAHKVDVIAFHGRHDFSTQKSPDPYDDPHFWTWGAFENGKLVSKITEIPYVMRFDGHDVKMSGIGGVATLPEYRKGGKVRQLFETMLADAYANGVVFSCLAPFSHQFYRRFGYELCCTRRELRIPVSELVKLKTCGAYTQIFPGDDTSDLQTLHEAYISDINHAVRRGAPPDNNDWAYFTRLDPYNTGAFVYIWRDDAGVPRSYIKYQHRRVADVSEIDAREIVFIDREALYALLAFVGSLSAEVKELFWVAPAFIEPSDFLDVAWVAKQRLIPQDMTRIVNLKTALELMRHPDGEGSYVIETEDPIVAENNGRWLVEFGSGSSRVTATQKGADLACELPALAQLVTGYRTLDNLMLTSRMRIEAHSNLHLLRNIFTQRPQHMTENF